MLSLVWTTQPVSLTVSADADAALLASAAALRRLGARITRYDTESGALEAKSGAETLRVTVQPSGQERSRLELASTRAARTWLRRLRAELTHPTKEVPR